MRIRSEIWVRAYLRRCEVAGVPAVVVRRGDDQAGRPANAHRYWRNAAAMRSGGVSWVKWVRNAPSRPMR